MDDRQKLLLALRQIYEMTQNGTQLPPHGKSKIAIIARSALKEAGELYADSPFVVFSENLNG